MQASPLIIKIERRAYGYDTEATTKNHYKILIIK